MNELSGDLTTAILIYFVQKWLKTMPGYARFVEWMPGAAKWAHRLVAALGAAIAAVGIHISLEGSYSQGWHGTFTIPDAWTLIHASWDWLKVFATQQWIYESAKPQQWYPNNGGQQP